MRLALSGAAAARGDVATGKHERRQRAQLLLGDDGVPRIAARKDDELSDEDDLILHANV